MTTKILAKSVNFSPTMTDICSTIEKKSTHYKCPKCEYSTFNPEEFNEHEKVNHSRHTSNEKLNKVSNSDSLPATDTVKCGQDKKSHRSNNEIRSHMNIHHKKPDSICRKDGKTVNDMGPTRSHEKEHGKR